MFRLVLGCAVLALWSCLSAASHAAETGSAVYVELQADGAETGAAHERWKLYGASHALVIGIDSYSNGWPRLSNAIKDAEAVAAFLKQRGFEVTTLFDPSGERLRSELRSFFALKGGDPEARLFVWFAGHGYTEFGEGYLVPADAPDPSHPEFRLRALHLGDVGSMVRIARSKHVFAVFDSCFAGTIFNASRARPPAAITRAVSEPVRQFLTSGGADQQVSDDGTFRRLFLKAVRGEEDADANADGYLTGTELSLFLEDRIVNLTDSLQTPRSGKLRDARFDQGDFIFLLPQAEAAQIAAANLQPNSGEGTRALPAADPELAVELAFWDAVKTSQRADDYRAYLAAYPEGRFAILAESRIAGLESESAERAAEDERHHQAEAERTSQVAALPPEPQADPAKQAELALALDRNDRRELQAALTALGFDTRGIDGFFGPGTRVAIKGYQASKGVEQSGFMSASLASSLLQEVPEQERQQTTALTPGQGQTDTTRDARIGTLEAEIASLRSALPRQLDGTGDSAFAYDGTWTGQVTRRSCAANYHGGPIEVRIEQGKWTTVSAPLPDFSGSVRDGKAEFSGLTSSGHDAMMEGTFSGDEFVGGVRFRVYTGMCRLDIAMSRQGTDQGAAEDEDIAARISILEQELENLRAGRGAQPSSLSRQTTPASQTAALPAQAALSKNEAADYIDSNGSALKRDLMAYNQRHRVILGSYGGTAERLDIVSWRVEKIEGEEAVVAVSYREPVVVLAGKSGTQRFLLKWDGSDFTFIGHEAGGNMRRTGG